MTPALLALTLCLADPLGFPSPPAVALAPQAVTAPAPAATPAPAARPVTPLTLPTTPAFGLDHLILPIAALLVLAIATLLATRRKQGRARLIQVLETTSLGAKRSLLVARVGDEIMVIGSSEAGLQLLAARPSGLEALAAEPPARLKAVPDPSPEAAAGPARHAVLGLLARLRGQPAGAAPAAARETPAFDALLAESSEDQELRRKLALGQPGSVR